MGSSGSCDDVVWFCLCRWENWEAREHSRCCTAPRSDFSSGISEIFCPFALSCGILCLKWSPEELLENPRVPRKTIANPVSAFFLGFAHACFLSPSCCDVMSLRKAKARALGMCDVITAQLCNVLYQFQGGELPVLESWESVHAEHSLPFNTVGRLFH